MASRRAADIECSGSASSISSTKRVAWRLSPSSATVAATCRAPDANAIVPSVSGSELPRGRRRRTPTGNEYQLLGSRPRRESRLVSAAPRRQLQVVARAVQRQAMARHHHEIIQPGGDGLACRPGGNQVPPPPGGIIEDLEIVEIDFLAAPAGDLKDVRGLSTRGPSRDPLVHRQRGRNGETGGLTEKASAKERDCGPRDGPRAHPEQRSRGRHRHARPRRQGLRAGAE